VAAPELVHFDGKRGRLGGFLYKPEGPGPFPAIVFNHGSEKLPGNKYGQALFYVPRGFVLFVPHRLGHGQSPGDYIVDARDREPDDRQAQALVSLLDAQVDDVADATAYLEALPFVNRAAVAMVGCSFGGIETLLASERDLGVRAAVDFAGAAMAWGENTPLQARMRSAARRARVPVFFAQAANDFDTRPSLELAKEMDSAKKPHALRIFPAAGSTAEEGHAFCSGGMQPPWGDDVIAFLAEHGIQGKARGAARTPVP
jgi:carboxymethylenebutenolidase